MFLKNIYLFVMLCIFVNTISSLQATEMINSTIDTSLIQKNIIKEISNDCVSKKQLWESLPNELLAYMIDMHHRRERILMVCTLRLVNVFLYKGTKDYFNAFYKEVLIYNYLEEQGAYFFNKFNLYRSFPESSSLLFIEQSKFEKSISQESIILTTELPGIFIKTIIHFSLELQDYKHWQLIFSTTHHLKKVEGNCNALLLEVLDLTYTFKVPEQLYKYPNNNILLRKIMNLSAQSSEKKQSLERFLRLSSYFPENHRKLYTSIQKIIKNNRKGIPIGISVFKIFVKDICLRQSIFENKLFEYFVDYFLYYYKKEIDGIQKKLYSDKIFCKQYVFECLERHQGFEYDRLYLLYEKGRFEEFIQPKGFLEMNTCRTAAEEVYKNEFFKYIWSYYLP